MTSGIITPDVAATPGDPSTKMVSDAGLVLFNPFLPSLFEKLGMISDSPKTKLPWKSVAVLQYLTHGEQREDAPLSDLVLRLCGLEKCTQVASHTELSDAETKLCDDLLQAAMKSWPPMRNTSLEGFRETFLRRQGKLEDLPEAFQLTVERNSFDMLLDQLPWTISVVKYDWMKRPLLTAW